MVKLSKPPSPAEIKRLCNEIRSTWTAVEYQKRSAPRQLSVWIPSLGKWAHMGPEEFSMAALAADRIN